MGISGLMSFINNHEDEDWFRPLQLKNSVLIIDGPCVFGCMLQNTHKGVYVFGGEYYELFDHLVNFFEQLKACNITPIVVMDGVSKSNKTATQLKRNQENIGRMVAVNNALSSGHETSNRIDDFIFPVLFKNVYIDAMKYCNVIFARSDYEGDSEAAELARAFNCPLLSYDSDFFVFDVQFVMYTRMDLSTVDTSGYVSCQVFNREAFYRDLSLAPGMLPVIAVLRGNDYVLWEQLKPIHHVIGGNKIENLVEFLQGRQMSDALNAAAGCYSNYKDMQELFKQIMRVYTETSTTLVPTLNKFYRFRRLKEGVNFREKQEDIENYCITSTFLELYRDCTLAVFVVSMFMKRPFILHTFVEDVRSTSAEFTCHHIIAALYTILLRNWKQKPALAVLYRDGVTVRKSQLTILPLEVGSDRLNGHQRKAIFFSVLKISDEDKQRLVELPKTWLIFAMSLIYWMKQCKPTVRRVQVESLLPHFVFLQVVQKNIGFFRTAAEFSKMFSALNIRSQPAEPDVVHSKQSVQDLMDSVTESESWLVAQEIFTLKVDLCEERVVIVPDIAVLHQFTVFQLCVYYVSQLGIILGCPFGTVRVHEMYWGTLLYGLYARLNAEGGNRAAFIMGCLSASPKIREIYTRTVDALNVYLPID